MRIAIHMASRAWLDRELAKAHDGPTSVVTHNNRGVSTRTLDPWPRARELRLPDRQDADRLQSARIQE
jgi:hypothetical protein